MSKMRIVFMGTPDFAVPCLDMLVSENYSVQAVVSQPDRPKGRGQKITPSPVKEAALAYGLPVITPERIKEPEFIEQIKIMKPDIIIVVAFGQLLPKVLLDLPALGCVNVHASLLPRYRGAAPIHWAVINGERTTGITTMYMDIGMDTGDMILKKEIPVGSEETTGELYDRLKILGAQVLSQTLKEIARGTAPRIKQEHILATYAPLLTRDIEKIDWGKHATAIHNLIRGLNPWPGAYCTHDNKLLKIWKTKIIDDKKVGDPGKLSCIGGAVFIETGCGKLELIEVQPESRKRMSALEYLRGNGSLELTKLE